MDTSVLIVGAGPAGLMLAAELTLAGAHPIVVERLAKRTGESRGLGFSARTMEVFDQRGLLPRFGELETSVQGHFGGIPLDFSVLPDAHAGVKHRVSQSETEQVLEAWVHDLDVDLRRGHALVSLVDDGDMVTAEISGQGATYSLQAQYVVGCDGGRSVVRKLAGFDFPGTAPTREMFLADLRDIDIEPRLIGQTVPNGMVMAARLRDDVHRIIVCEQGTPPQRRTEPPSFAEVAAAWQRLTGQDISTATPVWTSAFGDPARQVTEYRRGRVLLAGDAAHVHLPAGGQGMNVSIQDAVNLGWKLGAVVQGTGSVQLLDSYHHERHPVGQRLLMNAQAQGKLFLGGDEMQPVRQVFSELVDYDVVARHLVGMVSGLDVRYDVGAGQHPLLGMRLPPRPLVCGGDKIISTELLHAARGVLLLFDDKPALWDVASKWTDRIRVVHAELPEVDRENPLHEVAAVLVRPDGYVAWVQPGSDDSLADSLHRWFGSSS
ncbi:FAD-dependent monooxygenase [Nocardia sp. CNY236]|uniref:FAD-dependent monooxygenase n=1 Tax=Nocardia sp. CNY236 TaxID=1169152 RepID=UPI000427A560|nr:FAD-dependent monooxygenase [Nocardia sp. CNY236]